MEIISSPKEMQQISKELQTSGKKIALVPTMGCLHEGHLSLLRIARKKADIVVLSIFVNPIQFGDNEDFSRYPKNMEYDLILAKTEDVDIVFTPSSEEIYLLDFETKVVVPKLSNHLCGLSRLDFLEGVATVITILFHLINPNIAVFGEKDYQQLLVVRRLVTDLFFDIEIIGGPIVREADGLAMSSRNVYLTAEERQLAPSLYGALQEISKMIQANIRDVKMLEEKVTPVFFKDSRLRLEYLEFLDATTLMPVIQIHQPTLIALAAWIGSTRLIDNLVIY